MKGLSPYERISLVLLGIFLVFCVGQLASSGTHTGPWLVTTSKTVQAEEGSGDAAETDIWPESLLPGERIDVNSAPAADLTRLPQIGETRAQAIVDWREENGPFRNKEDLMQVYGIGPGILAQIQDYITVETTD